MREAWFESYLVQRVEKTGGITRKVKWIGRRGAPDRLVGWGLNSIHTARPVLIEMKRPKTPAAKDYQAREHERLRSIGFDVRVLATKEEIDAFIEEMTG